MDSYFLVITAIDVFVLGIMCILTKHSETLNAQQRRWFITAFALIIAISVLEVISIVVDREPAAFRWINILSNYLGFGLTPAIPIALASALDSSRSNKYAAMIEAVYLLFLAITFPLRPIFYVNYDNEYMRGSFFWIYLAIYLSAILYLIAMTLRVAVRYQNRSKGLIYPITAFLILGTMVQVVFPQIHVTWLCVTLLSILYFIYCNEMWQQLDGLTGLLNQNSYLHKTASLSEKGILIVFDVDDFKQINDSYGHLMGDQCLKAIAACIKKAYSKDGFCYRIGGDEFCVLLSADADEKKCYRGLINALNTERKTLSVLPYLSVGSAQFTEGEDALRVKETADNRMYQFKKERKNREIKIEK